MRLLTLREREERYIRRVFALCGRNVAKAASVLGIGRATMYRRMDDLGLRPASAFDAERRHDLEEEARLAKT